MKYFWFFKNFSSFFNAERVRGCFVLKFKKNRFENSPISTNLNLYSTRDYEILLKRCSSDKSELGGYKSIHPPKMASPEKKVFCSLPMFLLSGYIGLFKIHWKIDRYLSAREKNPFITLILGCIYFQFWPA